MRYLENRGSEWHKWDLHVHTPASGLNNQYGHTVEAWDEYVKVLFNTALEHDVVALGITDYFLIDGYKKLVNEYLNNEKKMSILFPDANTRERIKQILVLPNIEFRLDTMVNKNRVNYHVIFSDELQLEDYKRIIDELDNAGLIKVCLSGGDPFSKPFATSTIICSSFINGFI